VAGIERKDENDKTGEVAICILHMEIMWPVSMHMARLFVVAAKNEGSGMKLKIMEHKLDAASVALTLSGVVYVHTATQFRQHLKPLLNNRHKEIRVDLGRVNFIDSAGIAILVEGLQWSRDDARRFVLSGLSENVRDVFELSKLDTVFEIDNENV
jgi:anti-sigma B factor antagonist